MMPHFPGVGSTSDWLKICFRSTTQIWKVTHHKYGISAIISQTSFCRETGTVALQNVDCFLRLLQIYVFSVSVVNTHKKNNQLPSIKTNIYPSFFVLVTKQRIKILILYYFIVNLNNFSF